MITAKGDGSFDDFLKWAIEAGHGHYVVQTAYANYKLYCEYMKEVRTDISEQQRNVEE